MRARDLLLKTFEVLLFAFAADGTVMTLLITSVSKYSTIHVHILAFCWTLVHISAIIIILLFVNSFA